MGLFRGEEFDRMCKKGGGKMEERYTAAIEAVEEMLVRSRDTRGKFAPGTAQHTLQKNRAAALEVARMLLAAAAEGLPTLVVGERVEKAKAPLLSLQSKSAKAREKCKAGSWQRWMLERNLDALALVLPLLERAEREGLSLVCLSDRPEWLPRAAQWFHEKWHVPLAAYEESMADSLTGEAPVPRWYLVLHGEEMVAGLGVIENDFHDRPDLTPNVCAVYVEEPWRKKGIAGAMLGQVCRDMGELGVDTLYLITDHTNFYERYGWEFLCPVQGDGEDHLSRMYRHETGGSHG